MAGKRSGERPVLRPDSDPLILTPSKLYIALSSGARQSVSGRQPCRNEIEFPSNFCWRTKNGVPMFDARPSAAGPRRSISVIADKLLPWRTPAVILISGCVIGALGFGPRSALGLFLTPMSSANGWG